MKSNRNFAQAGFSLIELLVVVAIMLVVAAIAVPAIIASNQAGNETAAASTMRTVVTAENGYHGLYGNYSSLASKLGGKAADGCPTTPAVDGSKGCFMADEVAALVDAGTIGGYVFAYTNVDADTYTLTAHPATPGKGRKAFFVDQAGTIHAALKNDGTDATLADPILGK